MSVFKDKVLLITGGTDSFGNAVLNRFLRTDIGEIRIFSRDEKKQDDMRHDFQARMPEVANKIKFYIGDVLYIDDLVDEMIAGLEDKEHHCEFNGLDVLPQQDGKYCYCPITHHVTLGEIVELLKSFAEQPKTLMIPEIPANSFAKKLYSTYLSYLPYEKTAFELKMNVDERGSFTELVHTLNAGQVSINISKPGITKGQHWHNTKFEQFIVVKGHGLIQQRNLNDQEGKVLEWEVSGDKIEAVHMLPGYTHNIINLSETEDLVTVMYCNEVFNPNKPDTFFEPVSMGE